MELFEAIRTRRSIRRYEDKKVPKEAIEKLLDAAAMAPSARNSQSWRFVVIENPELIQTLSKRAKRQLSLLSHALRLKEVIESSKDTIFYGAPLLIFVTAPKDYKWGNVDTGIAAQNMMLAAHGLGLGSCYIGMANSLNGDETTRDELGIPKDHKIIAPLIFGYPAHERNAEKRVARILKRFS